MARILCAISGVEFTCEHFPVSLTSRECSHPVFSIPQKKLLSYAGKWSAGQLTSTDSYLLYLALFASTELVHFNVPAKKNDPVVAANMENLFQAIGKINIITHPSLVLPQFVVSADTSTLESTKYWIEAWHNAITDFYNGYKNAQIYSDLVRREQALERLIKDASKHVSSYSGTLAEWAAVVGDFPSGSQIQNTPYGPMTLREYWKLLIRKAARTEAIFSSIAGEAEKDLEELITYCEENIEHGSIYAHTLMQVLRNSRNRMSGLLGLPAGKYQILSGDSTVEDANKLAIIKSAPEFEPQPHQYETRFAFLKAKSAWQMAQRFKEEQALEPSAKDPHIVESKDSSELNPFPELEI